MIWFNIENPKKTEKLKISSKKFHIPAAGFTITYTETVLSFLEWKQTPAYRPPPPPKEATRLARLPSSYETVNLKMSFLFRPLSLR